MNACAIFFEKPLSYQDGLNLQNAVLEARISGTIPDTVLFLEHLPVITCGVRSKPEQIILPEAELKKKGIEVAESSRGGAVTFHGPGQVVMYPIMKLEKSSTDVHGYLYNLEETAIRAAASFGVTAYRRKGMTGAWTDQGKLAAIGVRFKHWVTYHGLSFNVNPDLSGFSAIIPCGLAGEKVTSLDLLLGSRSPSSAQLRECLATQFGSVFGRNLTVMRRENSPPSRLSSLISELACLKTPD